MAGELRGRNRTTLATPRAHEDEVLVGYSEAPSCGDGVGRVHRAVDPDPELWQRFNQWLSEAGLIEPKSLQPRA